MVVVSFIRHAETVSNRKHTIQGQQDGNLTHFGRKQAKRVAKRLENDYIPLIICSDLKRCRQTASKIAKYHPEVPILKDPRLRERAVGVLEGWPSGSTKELAAKVGAPERSFRPEGGESLKDVRKRAKNFWKELLNNIIPNCVKFPPLSSLEESLIYHYQQVSHVERVISPSMSTPNPCSTSDQLPTKKNEICSKSSTETSSGLLMVSSPKSIPNSNSFTDLSSSLSSLPPSLTPPQSPMSSSPDVNKSPISSILPPQPTQEATPHILVVTHSGFIKELLNYLNKFINPDPVVNTSSTKPPSAIYHTAIFSFKILSPEQAQPLSFSDVQHLKGLGKAYAEKFGFKKKVK